MSASPNKSKLLVIIGGPTASGKTELAVRLAQHFKTEIVSADSRQFYRELNIGVAKPNSAELALVKHHLIGHLSISDDYSAGAFARDAKLVLDDLFQRHEVAVMVGGSGLFVNAITMGFHRDLTTQAERMRSKALFEQHGLIGLQKALENEDIKFFSEVDSSNPHRLMRALERVWATGKTHEDQRRDDLEKGEYRILELGIDLPRDELYHRINQRVDQMMADGLLQEVKDLLPNKQANALQTVGYQELFSFLNGESSLEEAVEMIKRNTRRYAKRQLTWFRNKTETRWFKPSDYSEMISTIKSATID